MPKACFQLPTTKNYGFTKTKDCPWTGAMGCLTPPLHVTRLPNSRIKIFYLSILDQENDLFISLGSVIKSNRVRRPITPQKKPMINATSLTLGNFLKIDSHSSHTPKVRHTFISSFLTQKRKHTSITKWVVEQSRGIDRLVTPLGTLRDFSIQSF